MWRTALLTACLVLAGYGAALWTTHDFQVWTAEGARRLEVALKPVRAPSVEVDGPAIQPISLAVLLRGGSGVPVTSGALNNEDGTAKTANVGAPSGAKPAVTLVDFVYTRCQTVCLSLGSSFQQMQASLLGDRVSGQDSGVQLLSISFDGTYDTPAALAAYALRLQADPRIWRFARVADATQTEQLLRQFEVVVVPDGRGDYEHNAAFLVFDPHGRLVRIFDLAEQQLALDYARHLARKSLLHTASVSGVSGVSSP